MSEILERTVRNLRLTFEDLTLQKLIRIIIIAGAYALLRPYLMKLTGAAQMAAHEAPAQDPNAPRAQVSPNSLRGQVEIPEDSDDDEEGEEGEATGADWGKKARRRQRRVLKQLLDAEEERLAQEQEDEEDKDIEEFLEK